MGDPTRNALAEDALDVLLLDPSGRAATRRGRSYPIRELHRFLRRAAGRRLECERVEERERFRTLAPLFPDVLRELLRKFPSPPTDPA